MDAMASQLHKIAAVAGHLDAEFSGTRSLGHLERFLSTAKAGDTIVYHRGYLALDRGAGSWFGDNAGEELDHIATALMVMAEAGQVHLVQRRHGPFDYTYLAVMVRGTRMRRLA